MLCHALATKQVNTRDTRTFVKNSYKNGVGVVIHFYIKKLFNCMFNITTQMKIDYDLLIFSFIL